jgi:hypothetical protein
MKLPPSRRTAERQRLCGPLLASFKLWLDAEAFVVLPKAPIADAIGYTRNQWDALSRFVEDARLKLDNNIAERQLRRVAVGRNYGESLVMRSALTLRRPGPWQRGPHVATLDLTSCA